MITLYLEDIAALRDFSKNNNAIITAWDKGRDVVIMDSTQETTK